MEPVEIAGTAVSAARYDIDIPYDYLIPAEFAEQVRPGVRVMVPFGKGNRLCEGMVLSVRRGEKVVGLKPILGTLDTEPVLDAAQLALAFWMRQRYFCTLYDVIHAILPVDLWYRIREFWSLTDDWTRCEAEIRTWKHGPELLDALRDHGGRADIDALRAVCDKARPVLRAMAEAGAVRCEADVKPRTPSGGPPRSDPATRMAELAVSAAEALSIAEHARRRTPIRYEVTRLLAASGKLSVSEVCYFTGASPRMLREMEKAGLLLFSDPPPVTPDVPDVPPSPLTLNAEQQAAFDKVAALMDRDEGNVALLQGVTGSGKTQVYLRLAEKALDMGRTAMVLVPEIILTPQVMGKFRACFGEQAALLHSGLKLSERHAQWERVRNGTARVVLGTRSAIFAPLRAPALIVLDEEQEASYDSQNTPRYRTQDVAKYLCARNRATLLLGSATPAVETAWEARTGRYHYAALRHRYNERGLPKVLISDLREELRAGNAGLLGRDLCRELSENLQRGEQSILFLNRRGSSRMLLCMECGHVPECPRCSVPMTYHSANNRLMCHYCGHSERGMDVCPTCGGVLKHIGAGTQKVEEELRARFPGVEALRMDADTAAGKQGKLLEKFEKERIPILLGTQMVARGLDFENVTLVGALLADTSLYLDHYRAAERTFSLLTQVVGRAGRGSRQGRAVIQTYQPDSDLIRSAAAQDYDRFYQTEIRIRRARRYPPFADLFTLTVSGVEEQAVFLAALKVRDTLRNVFAAPELAPMRPEILGPAPAPVLRLKGRYRYRVLLVAKNEKPVRDRLGWLSAEFLRDRAARGLLLSVDCNGEN
ncbi:MAG: primosomal protein N' [Oscillibacter sp.]|nr:primosomal protein N' [Oscillibacter sp.]